MIRYNPRNTIWLAALSVLMALVIISDISLGVQALLAGIFALALAGAFIDFGARRALGEALRQRSPLSKTRMTPQAREAVARANSRLTLGVANLQLTDIGLIATQTGSDGMNMRRTRSVSKDDDGVRPYITLYVPSAEADRSATVQFELYDQNGEEQYRRVTTAFLRSGEMNILADTHLPLFDNDHISGVGDWDLRVSVDGVMLGIHSFALTASVDERRRRLRRESNDYYAADDGERAQGGRHVHIRDDAPMSLEELLRNQNVKDQSERR